VKIILNQPFKVPENCLKDKRQMKKHFSRKSIKTQSSKNVHQFSQGPFTLHPTDGFNKSSIPGKHGQEDSLFHP
jgi:hypothetical protein